LKNMTRKDSWSESDDLLLAETVLRNTREGKSQAKAFIEASEKLNRTTAACSVRWTTALKKHYEKAYKLAKKSRTVKGVEKKLVRTKEEEGTFKEIFVVLQKHAKEYERMERELKHYKKRTEELERENETIKRNGNEMSEDYQQMLKILTKASQMIS